MDYNIQMLKSITTLTLVTLEQAEAVARIDSLTVTTNCSKYCKSNNFSYYVLLNVWGHQIISLASEEAWVYIWIRIQKKGLLAVIRETVELSDLIIHGEAPDWDYTYGYLGVLANKDYSTGSSDLVDTLRVLRFPKRFSPRYADIVQQSSLEAFLGLNTKIKANNLKYYNWSIVSEIKKELHKMLSNFRYDLSDGYFSSGNGADCTKILLKKLKCYAASEPNLADITQFPLSAAAGFHETWRETRRLRDTVVVQAVPKSYKAARIIAKEPIWSAFALQAIAKGVLDAVKRNGYLRYINIEDQRFNHELCYKGSIDGSYATIDLTSASDSISEAFARSVLPSSLITACDNYRCMYLTAGKEKRVMQMFATSGSPLTFIVESCVFLAIAKVCTEIVSSLIRERLLPPRVYGDDIIIDDRACEFCCDVLQNLGFFPNEGKTFFGKSPIGYYRESCGVEFLNGAPMHHAYYPRQPIMANQQGVAALCEMQHKFYDNWKIRMFLSQVVLCLEPRMTSHPYGCDCADLWDQQSSGLPIQLKGSGDQPCGLRYKHLAPIAQYAKEVFTEEDRLYLEMWYYFQHLKFGPSYDEDPLLKSLGITISRANVVADSSASKIEWRYRIE